MRILVTGASGFVGSLLVPRLHAGGHTVRALGRDPERVRRALEGRPAPAHAADVTEDAGDCGDATSVSVVRGDALTGQARTAG